MGNIEVIGKWDLQKNNWNTLKLNRNRAFAFANYEPIIGDMSKGIDYIIFAHGSRVENHSKDHFTIKESEAGIKNIIDYYQSKNKNIIIKLFLMDADAPIVEDAKLMAKQIDELALDPNTNSINLIGLSKCGAMSFYVPKYLQTTQGLSKTNVYTVASPFEGTKLASPKIFYPELRKVITSKLGDNKLGNLVSNKIISFYEGISSNSHMDYDIAMLGGIPESNYHLYDESLIRDIFSIDNLEAISNINAYRNIVTEIDDETLKEALKTMNFTGIGLCILNDLFFDKKSDGMVLTSSQKLVESQFIDFKSHTLSSCHHDVTSVKRATNDLLHIVDDTIDEQNERAKYLAKHFN